MSSWIQAIFGSNFGTAESENFGGAAFLSTRGVHVEMKLHPKSRKDIIILYTSSQILLVRISPSKPIDRRAVVDQSTHLMPLPTH